MMCLIAYILAKIDFYNNQEKISINFYITDLDEQYEYANAK